MINISEVTNCYGCMACVDRCPENCIGIGYTRLGHLIPVVDQEHCIDCNACVKVCPVFLTQDVSEAKKAMASWTRDSQSRLMSSSGGIAMVISQWFIANEGAVYGCSFVRPFDFRHVRCTEESQLDRLRGSKYVQSDTADVYSQIQQDIKDNKSVLFIGTPCQVAGIKSFFCSHPLIYTIDLVCHGVPSVEMLKDSLPAGIFTQEADSVEFRVCRKYHFSLKSGISTVYERPLNRDWYLKGFFTGLFYRDSCYTCRFASLKRAGDITLGDFWGVRIKDAGSEEDKGISLCLVNTLKGEDIMKKVNDRIISFDRPIEEAVKKNHQLQHPVKLRMRAKLFRLLYPRLGFKKAIASSIPEIILKNYLCH